MSQASNHQAESIRHRLRNRLRERGEDVQFGLVRYAAERFLYKLGASAHRSHFVLKGAALLAIWGGPIYRPTRDLDFTGYGSTNEADIIAAIRDVCRQQDEVNELVFDPNSITAEQIRDEGEYHGLRIRLRATLGESEIPLQIDIGFGNAIEPPPQDVEYPTLLGNSRPWIRAYGSEAMIAEKFHAMVVLGERNSRYKDFYDLYTFAQQLAFDGGRLSNAIIATFQRRRTKIDASVPVALTARFYADDARAGQWRAYLTRNALPGATTDFALVGEQLQSFLSPLWNDLAAGRMLKGSWPPIGPWKTKITKKGSSS